MPFSGKIVALMIRITLCDLLKHLQIAPEPCLDTIVKVGFDDGNTAFADVDACSNEVRFCTATSATGSQPPNILQKNFSHFRNRSSFRKI